MKAACVIGEEFYRNMLDPVLPVSFGPLIDDILESLVASGHLVCLDNSPPCYGFPSTQICQILLDMLPKSEAMPVHASIGKYLQDAYSDSIEDYYRSLSYHFGFCPEHRSEAFKYDMLSLDQSLNKGSRAEAVVYAREASRHAATLAEWNLLETAVDFLVDLIKPSSGDQTSKSVVQQVLSWMNLSRGAQMDDLPCPRPTIESYMVDDLMAILETTKSIIAKARKELPVGAAEEPLGWELPHISRRLAELQKSLDSERKGSFFDLIMLGRARVGIYSAGTEGESLADDGENESADAVVLVSPQNLEN